MKKPFLYILLSVVFIAGIGIGVLGHWYFSEELPRDRAMAEAKRQQEEMNRMVRSGIVTAVKPDEITIKVENSGDPAVEAGQEITLKVDVSTTLQEGMNVLNSPGQGELFDLNKIIKSGMRVDILDRNGRAIALHWENPGHGDVDSGPTKMSGD